MMRPEAERPGTPRPPQLHALPPEVRVRVLAALPPRERLLLTLVCCSCTPLQGAARVVGLSADEAEAMWRRVLARVADPPGGGPPPGGS